MIYLALRKTTPNGIGPKVFAWLTMIRLVTRYPHAGVVIDDVLHQATLKDGVHFSPFEKEGWDIYPLTIDKSIALNRFQSVNGARYDWFSLLAFILPFRVSMGSWCYCYELSYFMITGIIPTQRITPEDLLRITHATNETTAPRTMGVVY